MKKKMMTVFTIGVMSLSILGGASPSETAKEKTNYTQRSKEQLNNGKIHAVHTEEKAENLGIETEGKEQITLEKEIHETEVGREAEQLGISIEGKDVGTLSEEIYETKIKQEALKLGISIENTT
ncbi:hypothetical protein, partial [Pseudomonas aeruginosa]|uniref:hypothetical protein n=1 Tax=Pseudomonas aeruginosa TaxID=287 RepID=UPI001E5FAB92